MDTTMIWLISLLAPVGLSAVMFVVTTILTAFKDAETRRLTARTPFLNRQLELYLEATKVAAKFAVSDVSPSDAAQSKQRFWELYWGELPLVEDRRVENAMVCLGARLKGEPRTDCECESLQDCVLELAHACRQSLAQSWGVKDWRYE